MTLTIDLSPIEESQLTDAARQKGLDPAALVKQLVAQHLPPVPAPAEDPTLALFAQWEREDALRTTEQIAEDDRLWEEFTANINVERDRAGARRVF